MEILKRSGIRIKQKLAKDSVFYSLLIFEIILFSWLNSENQMMSDIVIYYKDFAGYIASGFADDFVFKGGNPTFPMWGYGWVLLIFKNKWLIIVLQQMLSIYTIYFIQRHLKFLGYSNSVMLSLRFLLLFAIGWFLFHSAFWPYSFAANLLVISLLLMSKAKKLKSLKYCIISALTLGVCLNLRSDYLYFAFTLCALSLIYTFFRDRARMIFPLVWIAVVLFSLIPWSLYTYDKLGTPKLSSTNSGHVLYISLGQYPHNIWGITPLDGDPSMHKYLRKTNGKEISSLSLTADEQLKDLWVHHILEHPGEYIKKCIYNIYLTIVRPFSHGEIYKKFSNGQSMDILKQNIKDDLKAKEFSSLIKKAFEPQYSGFLLQGLVNAFNILFFLFLFGTLLFGFYKFGMALFTDWFILSMYAVIFYQLALLVLAYTNPNYHTNILPFYIIISAIVISSKQAQSEARSQA